MDLGLQTEITPTCPQERMPGRGGDKGSGHFTLAYSIEGTVGYWQPSADLGGASWTATSQDTTLYLIAGRIHFGLVCHLR